MANSSRPSRAVGGDAGGGGQKEEDSLTQAGFSASSGLRRRENETWWASGWWLLWWWRVVENPHSVLPTTLAVLVSRVQSTPGASRHKQNDKREKEVISKEKKSVCKIRSRG